MRQHSTAETVDQLRRWLIETVADYAEMDPATVVATAPFAEYGLDSVHALALCGDIEDKFGVIVEPTLLWDHPSIEALVQHLSALPEVRAGARPT
jgi:acyl carrier protein